VVGEDISVRMCVRGDGNGAFVIAELCEALMREPDREDARKKVKGWFATRGKDVEGSQAKGKKLLSEKIALL
jgi:pumilio family protein 6